MQNSSKDFYKKLLGRNGEKLAEKYLKKQKYKILEKNYKTHLGEIDIIALDGNTVVFVEVKTRTDESFGRPADAVTKIKRNKYFKVATEYLLKKSWLEKECRFDVIEILNGEINHIKSAFTM